MTSALVVLAIRPASLASLALAAALSLLTPAGSRAEGPTVSPADTRLHDTHEGTVRSGPVAETVGLATGRNDETPASDGTLAENAWDFTNPGSIPGFASTPYPLLSDPEILD